MKKVTETQDFYQSILRIQVIVAMWMGEIAERLKPFDATAAKLLEAMGHFEKNHVVLFSEQEGGAAGNLSPVAHLLCADFEEAYGNRFKDAEHFFVVNKVMAYFLLLQARRVIHHSLMILTEISKTSDNLTHKEMLNNFCRSKDKYEIELMRLIRNYRICLTGDSFVGGAQSRFPFTNLGSLVGLQLAV